MKKKLKKLLSKAWWLIGLLGSVLLTIITLGAVQKNGKRQKRNQEQVKKNNEHLNKLDDYQKIKEVRDNEAKEIINDANNTRSDVNDYTNKLLGRN